MEVSDILPVSSEDEEDSDPPPYPRELSMDPNGADLLLGCSSTSAGLRHQHPDPIQGFRLWQAFLDNVNPVTKLIHAPSVQQTILEAMGNLNEVPKATESLMFAIYASAVCSLSNLECEGIIGDSRSVALIRFQSAAKQALVNACLLKTSNMVVLQAYMLFLVSMSPPVTASLTHRFSIALHAPDLRQFFALGSYRRCHSHCPEVWFT